MGSTPPGLVGRAREREAFARALQQLAAGVGGVTVLDAPPGLGKTALVGWVAHQARNAGVRGVEARADPLTVDTPFAVASQLLPSLSWKSDALAGAASGAPGTASGALFEVVERARETIEAMALDPVLMSVDDLHWVDGASLAVLAAAAELATTLPLLLVVTTRPVVAADQIDVLDRAFGRSTTRLDLAPLDPGEAAELAARRIDATPGPRLGRLIDGVAGNPLLVIELLGDLEADDELVRTGDVVETDRVAMPPTLQATVIRRLRRLGDDVVDAVRALSVAGPAGDIVTIAQMLDRTPDQITRSLETTHGVGMLEVDADHYVLRHELLREAVYFDMPEPTRASMHRRMANILDAAGREPALVAAHLALGASPGDEHAVAWLAAAADDAQQAAPTSALALVDKALELTVDDPSGQRALQRARLDLLIQLGRLDEATTLATVLARILAEELTAADLAALYGRAAGLLTLQRRAEDGLALLDQGIREIGDPAAGARLLAQRASAKMAVADHSGAAADAHEAIARTRECGDDVGASIALAVAGRIGSFSHDYRRGLEPGLEAVLTAEQEPSGEAHLHLPCFYYALSGIDVDDLALAERSVARGRGAATRLGHVYALPLYAGAAASVHYRRGELDDAWAEASAGLSLARDTGSHQASMWCEAFRALVALLRGELAAAREHATAAEEAWAAHSAPLGVDFMALAVAGVAEASGDVETAFEVLDGAWEAFGAIGVRSCQPLLGADLVRAGLASEQRERAREVAAMLTDVAALSGLEAHRALAAQAVALVEQDVSLLREAVRRNEAAGRSLDAALCLADAARVSHRAGDDSAPALAVQAATRLHDLGATGAAERLAQQLHGDVPSPGHDKFGWDSLTRTESAIVALVAAGLTNAEIADRRSVSRRTVESHLVRVYTKLGISSRVQLAVEAAHRGFA